MSLCEPALASAYEQDVRATGVWRIGPLELAAAFFGPALHVATEVVFKPIEGGSRCVILVDGELRYIGSDPAITRAFANPEAGDWRPLAIVQSADTHAILRFADALLGLDGLLPRVPVPTQQRELVVSPLDPGTSHRSDPTSRFGVDLVAEAREGRLHRPLFREAETDALIRVLLKAGKNAACLVGEAGVGKTAVVEGLAVAIAEDSVPPSLAGSRVLDVNLAFLAAGARGEFESRIKELADAARRDSRVILFFDEAHLLVAPSSDASQMLKADLGRGRIRCVGATTTQEWRRIQADPALDRRFQVVPIKEITPAQAIEVLVGRREWLQQHHGVTIPDRLVVEAVDLTVRHLPDRRLPDKALDLLDEACARLAMRTAHGASS